MAAPKSRSRRKSRADQPVRLVGYVRVSSEEQATEGVSLDAQRERLAAYATAHEAELVAIDADEGLSGKVPPEKRPGLSRALECIAKGEADGVVVIKLDRLSRSTRDVLDLVDASGRRGWRLVSVSEHLDTSTAAGRLVVTVLAALAQMEREQVGERTQFALDAVARSGRARSRWTPFGWRTAGGAFEVSKGDREPLVKHGEEQKALARIVRLRRRGDGARRIAAKLNAEGANPRNGRPWTSENVASILRRLDRWEAAGVG